MTSSNFIFAATLFALLAVSKNTPIVFLHKGACDVPWIANSFQKTKDDCNDFCKERSGSVISWCGNLISTCLTSSQLSIYGRVNCGCYSEESISAHPGFPKYSCYRVSRPRNDLGGCLDDPNWIDAEKGTGEHRCNDVANNPSWCKHPDYPLYSEIARVACPVTCGLSCKHKMADTGGWHDNQICADGSYVTKKIILARHFADFRNKCEAYCVTYDWCHYIVSKYSGKYGDGHCKLYSGKCKRRSNEFYNVWIRDYHHCTSSSECGEGSICESYYCVYAARAGVESAIGDIDDKKPHKFARSMNVLQKEEVIGFLSLTRSRWMEILAIVGLLAVVRSIYSVCTRKAGDTYQEV